MRGNVTKLSERKLMDCLTRLGYDIEIKVRPAKSEVGHLMLALLRWGHSLILTLPQLRLQAAATVGNLALTPQWIRNNFFVTSSAQMR
jgi:Helix-turn-helix domain